MTNIEFMQMWNQENENLISEMSVQKLNDAQMLAYMNAKAEQIDSEMERLKVRQHVLNTRRQELGAKISIKVRESDMKYVPTAEAIIAKKKGMTDEEKKQYLSDLEDI